MPGPIWITDPHPPTPVETMTDDELIEEWQLRRNGIRGLVLAEEYMRRALKRKGVQNEGPAGV